MLTPSGEYDESIFVVAVMPPHAAITVASCVFVGVAAIMASVVPQTPPVSHAATGGPVIR